MENEVIETRTARIWLGEDGIIRTVFLTNSELTLEDAKEIDTVTSGMTDGKEYPFLIDLRKIKSVAREVRNYGSEMKTRRNASALLISSPLSRVLGNLYLGINKPIHPVKLFVSEDEAIKWLKGFMETEDTRDGK